VRRGARSIATPIGDRYRSFMPQPMIPALALVTAATLLTACHAHGGHAPPPAPATQAAAAPAPSHAALSEAAIAIPIAAGKTAAWQAALDDLLGPRYAEYDASRRRYGLTSQTTFVQRTPMGDFALIHLTGPDVRASFHAMSTSQDPWDVEWRRLTLDLHGLDFAQGERVEPRIEPMYTMTSEAPSGRAFMFLAPLSPDGAARLRALAGEVMGARHADYIRARTRLGVSREVVFLETTARGDVAVFYWLAADPAASLRRLVASDDPFDAWLRSAATAAHPIALATIAEIAARNTLIASYPHEVGHAAR